MQKATLFNRWFGFGFAKPEPGSANWYFRRDRIAVVSLGVILFMLFVALFAPFLTAYPNEGLGDPNLANKFLPPSADHWFGTDDVGRDILARVIYGSRTALIAAFAIVIVAIGIGTTLGAFAGYFGGWTDEIIMRITDIFLAFPPLLLAITIASVLEPNLRNSILAVGLTWWPWYTRLVRAQAISIRERNYVRAARSMGVSDVAIIRRHILPNVLAPVMVQGTLDLGVVHDLQVVFHSPAGDSNALRGVSFDIERGKIFGIVGESGCGKSMTGKALMGLVPHPGEVTGGQIIFEGEDLLQKSPKEVAALRGNKIGMIFQDPSTSLNPVFTIEQQMIGIMSHHHQVGTSRPNRRKMQAEFKARAIQLLGDVGLPNPANIMGRYPHELSGGMQQRVMIAMALSMEADLLIADEPTTALDVTIQAQILELLVKLRDEKGVTIMLITHDMGVVAETCDEMAVFYAGRVVEQGIVAEVFKDPKHPYTQALLSATPIPDPEADRTRIILEGNVPSPANPPSGCRFHTRCQHVIDRCPTEKPAAHGPHTHWATCHLLEEN